MKLNILFELNFIHRSLYIEMPYQESITEVNKNKVIKILFFYFA